MADNPPDKDTIQQVLIKQENEELKENQHKEIDYHRYWKDMYEKEHKLKQEAKERIKELENSLSISLEINDRYQRELKEVREDNQKLATQIEHRIGQLRKAGM